MKKFSVIIAIYNQMKYVETSLLSVLNQNYENIEIIVADDCSSDYDEKKIKKIVEKNNHHSFDYKLIHNESNLGIVRNIKNAIENSSGEYVLFFAGDDKLKDENVISMFAKEFKDKSKNIITSQCLEYDNELKENLGIAINRKKAFRLNNASSYEQYAEMCLSCFYSSGATAYRKKFLNDNPFSLDYKHVEDWSNWLRYLRNGEKIYFADFCSLCHRDGGISHNNSKKKPKHVQEYYNDMKNVYKKEIFKNLFFLKFKDRLRLYFCLIKKILIRKKKIDYLKSRELHSFIICAYKEEHYLEDCVASLLSQTLKSKVIISTSTPNDYITSISHKYNIDLVINTGERGHTADFIFAYSNAKTKYVTLCHQDDIYYPTFAERIIHKMEKKEKTSIAFSNYNENRNEKTVKRNGLLITKRIINFPLIFFGGSRFIRRFTLSLGNAICAPSVTYNTRNVKCPVKKSDLVSNVDWDSWIYFANKKMNFVYVPKALLEHRIHEGSTTTMVINNNIKSKEDYMMFNYFWPKSISKVLVKLYDTSEKSNTLKSKKK